MARSDVMRLATVSGRMVLGKLHVAISKAAITNTLNL